jgi:putative transposase
MDANLKLKVEQLVSDITSQAQTLDDLNGLFRSLLKSALERMLDTELDVHLGRKALPALTPDAATISDSDAPKNRRNGHSPKTVRGEMGEITLDTPRDRNGTFEPPLIPKHQRRLTGFDEKILALYAKGLSTRDIQDIVKELYGVDVSPTRVSEITADLDAEVSQGRHRRLDSLWPIVYLDGLVVHVRGDNGRVSEHTMDVAIGVNLQGKKELLGLWLGETEGAKFWLNCLMDLKNRGLNDIFIVCGDGLTGFPEAIRTAYPQTKVQLCLVPLVRAALKYGTDKDSKAVARDLKKIYQAATVLEAEQELEHCEELWGDK